MDDGRAGTRLDPRDVHDFWPRVLASPILGAIVVNLSGLIDHARHTTGGLIASYTWFALVAFLVWEGNRRLYFRLPRREDWLLRPWRRLARRTYTPDFFEGMPPEARRDFPDDYLDYCVLHGNKRVRSIVTRRLDEERGRTR